MRIMNQRGSALVMAMLVLMLTTALALPLVVLGMKEKTTSSLWKTKTQVFYAAEAGLEQAKHDLAVTSLATLYAARCPAVMTGSLNDVAYTVRVQNQDGACDTTGTQPVVITSSASRVMGWMQNAVSSRTITAVVQSQSPFSRWALFGDIGTVLLNGTATVNGNVGSNGGVTENGNVTVNGLITPSAGIVYPMVPCPAQYTSSVSGSGSYDAATGTLVATGADAVAFTGPGMYSLHSLTMRGSSTLTVSGGPVTIFIDGSLTISGGGVVNITGSASNLAFVSCGVNTTPWAMNGGARAQYVVYAPTNPVTLNGTDTITGSIIAGSITDNGGPSVTWDPSVADVSLAQRIGAPSNYTLVRGTWTQN